MDGKIVRTLISDCGQFVAGDCIEFIVMDKTRNGTIVDFDSSGRFVFIKHSPDIFDGDSKIDCFALKDITSMKLMD